jgi:hypothetical protein
LAKASPTVRQQLADLLTPKLPNGWLIVSNERAVEASNRTVLRLSQQSLVRHPQAPLGALLVTFAAYVMTPGADPVRQEDALDDDVTAFLFAVDSLGGNVAWSTCEKRLFDDVLGYEIALTITVNRPL